MKQLILLAALCLLTFTLKAQRLVFDKNHYNIVNENGAVRLAAENTHTNSLHAINNKLSDIKLNLASVVLAQDMILESLKEVNQALKSGLAVVQITNLSSEIVAESNQMIRMAEGQPQLLLFAEDTAAQMKRRGLHLVTEVSGFVLKEGANILMDFEKRDFLLRKITLELQVIRSQVYGMRRAMYWARYNGLLRTANPYRNYVNQDKLKASEIIRHAKYLTK